MSCDDVDELGRLRRDFLWGIIEDVVAERGHPSLLFVAAAARL
jgi:hypothetical protein